MSNISKIIIDVEDLIDEQQIHLWKEIWFFADEGLPHDKMLKCFVVTKKNGC